MDKTVLLLTVANLRILKDQIEEVYQRLSDDILEQTRSQWVKKSSGEADVVEVDVKMKLVCRDAVARPKKYAVSELTRLYSLVDSINTSLTAISDSIVQE